MKKLEIKKDGFPIWYHKGSDISIIIVNDIDQYRKFQLHMCMHQKINIRIGDEHDYDSEF